MTTTELAAANALTLSSKQQQYRSLLLFLICCICFFELFYLLLFALSPFPGLHLSSTPIGEEWPWTFWPAQVLTTIISPLIAVSSRHEWISSVLLGMALTGLTGTYALTIVVLFRHYADKLNSRRWFLLLMLGTLIFCVTLLFQPLLLSDDVFSYIFSGRILSVYGADPLNTAPIQFPFDPYLKWVLSGRASPNIFGPLWLCVASLLTTISNVPVITLLLFKGIAVLSHLVNSILIWALLGRVAPRRRLLGVLLYAWNPLAIIELAGSGHNEGVLLTLFLLATLLYVYHLPGPQRDNLHNQPLFPPWLLKSCALLFLGLAIGMNLIALLIAPLLLWFDMRTEQNVPRALWKVTWRALVMLIPSLIVSLPFWRGASTFMAITSAIDMQHFIYSPISLLANPLHRLFGFVALVVGFPLFEQPAVAADVTLRASASFIFVLIYVHLFSQVRAAPTTLTEACKRPHNDKDIIIPGFDTLLSSWGIAIFCYMVLVSGWFWPWYLLWMLWVVVVQRLSVFTSAMLVLSGTALFIYPFVGFSTGPMATHQAALIFGIPLFYLIVAWSKQRYVERTITQHDRRS